MKKSAMPTIAVTMLQSLRLITRATKKEPATKSRWHRGGGVRTTKDPSIPVNDRSSQFPGQSFVIRFGKPFFSCYKIPKTIKIQIATSKRTGNLVKYNERVARNSRLADSISNYYSVNPSEKGASVQTELSVERFVVARACLAAGCFYTELGLSRT